MFELPPGRIPLLDTRNAMADVATDRDRSGRPDPYSGL